MSGWCRISRMMAGYPSMAATTQTFQRQVDAQGRALVLIARCQGRLGLKHGRLSWEANKITDIEATSWGSMNRGTRKGFRVTPTKSCKCKLPIWGCPVVWGTREPPKAMMMLVDNPHKQRPKSLQALTEQGSSHVSILVQISSSRLRFGLMRTWFT